ncbi:DNA topoisomerase III [Alkalihalobacillus pseudalcaliphilus]|uniref:DNA topoisomerase III n=1 Tax=Alkalihalobacillus pseudalcaliphilus TaxID=79884 RepID=UPI00064E0C65|nr:DNA topoisomerase III [Alkalihalobacillus pseudalcaliphilus]KMK78181.1 DNA topoisomerase III [Alkalihalobacillus pseudalcaliphilus]
MTKKVVLAEKPSVARDLARVLQCTEKRNGFFEGKEYIVTWALGHLVTLAPPESYGKSLQQWRLEDLPMLPSPLNLVVIKQSQKQFQTVKAQLNRKDVSEVIIATDAGREGELVARWILAKAGTNKKLKRLWISSVTDKAIKEGFKKLKDGRQYEGLYHSAVARSEADWYVGMNGTRALTTKFNAQLSCGRVQTPTLAMIEKREEDIRQFKPIPYWLVKGRDSQNLTWQWFEQKNNENRLFAKQKAEKIHQIVSSQSMQVIDVKTAKKMQQAPKLFDLTELQREANKRFGFSAKETLSTLQRLYEQYKIVTYPRTDSHVLSSDLIDTLYERLAAVDIPPYRKLVSTLKRDGFQIQSHAVNDKLVSDHHAIIPTEQLAPPSLSAKERKLYDLIVQRFLAVLYPVYRYEQTTVTAGVGEQLFKLTGKKELEKGWKVVFEDQETSKESSLPLIKKGDSINVKSVELEQHLTKPPARFSEGTLLSAMEKPAAFLENKDPELVDSLGKAGGIGTVATRADIIEKLLNTHLMEKRGQELMITSKGSQLLELVPAELKSPALTAEWERKLELITEGKLKKEQFIQEMKQYATSIVKEIKASDQRFKHDNVTGSKCPECGKLLLEVNGKKGKMHVCQDRECGFKKSVVVYTNARCPQCRKKLELRGQGEGQVFACVCGHREKKSSFEKRKKATQNQRVSKKEVNRYMNQQNKEDGFTNSALADALAKLKKE